MLRKLIKPHFRRQVLLRLKMVGNSYSIIIRFEVIKTKVYDLEYTIYNV